jgi:hypothetical protein
MIRTLVATGVFAVAGFAGVAAAPAASATPLCQVVSVDTVATSPVGVTECIPYGGAPECVADEPSFLPWFSAYVQVCVPALVAQ